MKKNIVKIWMSLALLGLVSGCATVQSEPNSSSVSTSNIEWAFTRENQHPEEKLIKLINSAQTSIDIAIYSFTKEEIAQAIIDAQKKGISVRVITDEQSSKNKSQKSLLQKLKNAKVPLKEDTHSGLMHLKVTIVDNEIISTGSYNYTNAASNKNDEVLLIIHDKTIANEWSNVFNKMWNDSKKFTEYK
ncbi:phospholipase D family protein [Brevibacillus panacihumi]|uniref:phospholipase D family nuclease n=1 Tax=Brevibacillus panacihumi TaxID=497735 RepID=UPI003D08CA1B